MLFIYMYVLLRYVKNPLLYKNKKFHFRCYTMMSLTTAMIYQYAFILSASINFDYNDDNINKHITNLSINKKFENHPGQIPCDLKNEYPMV